MLVDFASMTCSWVCAAPRWEETATVEGLCEARLFSTLDDQAVAGELAAISAIGARAELDEDVSAELSLLRAISMSD